MGVVKPVRKITTQQSDFYASSARRFGELVNSMALSSVIPKTRPPIGLARSFSLLKYFEPENAHVTSDKVRHDLEYFMSIASIY